VDYFCAIFKRNSAFLKRNGCICALSTANNQTFVDKCLLFHCIAVFEYFLTLKVFLSIYLMVADQNRHQDDVAPAEEGGEEDQGPHGG
jgi:hypothetical protein